MFTGCLLPWLANTRTLSLLSLLIQNLVRVRYAAVCRRVALSGGDVPTPFHLQTAPRPSESVGATRSCPTRASRLPRLSRRWPAGSIHLYCSSRQGRLGLAWSVPPRPPGRPGPSGQSPSSPSGRPSVRPCVCVCDGGGSRRLPLMVGAGARITDVLPATDRAASF